MNKLFCLKRFLPFLMFFLLFGIGVNAKIVSESCEQEKVGNSYQLNCYSGAKWIQDENKVWQDFNKVVSVNFRNREIFVEWNENVIELNPFIIYNGNQYYTQQIPDNLWEQVNWRNILHSERSFFKFALKLRRVNGISAVGFDINSNLGLPEFIGLQGNFEKIGIDFSDLKDAGFCLKKQLKDNNIIEVKITCLPLEGEDWDLDPTILQSSTADRRILKHTVLGAEPYIEYSCTNAKLTDRLIGYGEMPGEYKNTYRVAHDFDLSDIPSNAVITKIELEVQILNTATLSNSEFNLRKRTTTITQACNVSFFNSCANGTLYYTADSWNSTGWKGPYDLGSNAVIDARTALSAGTPFQIAIQYKSDTSNEELAGLSQQSSGARITITYHRNTTPFFLVNDFQPLPAQWLKDFWIANDFITVGGKK